MYTELSHMDDGGGGGGGGGVVDETTALLRRHAAAHRRRLGALLVIVGVGGMAIGGWPYLVWLLFDVVLARHALPWSAGTVFGLMAVLCFTSLAVYGALTLLFPVRRLRLAFALSSVPLFTVFGGVLVVAWMLDAKEDGSVLLAVVFLATPVLLLAGLVHKEWRAWRERMVLGDESDEFLVIHRDHSRSVRQWIALLWALVVGALLLALALTAFVHAPTRADSAWQRGFNERVDTWESAHDAMLHVAPVHVSVEVVEPAWVHYVDEQRAVLRDIHVQPNAEHRDAVFWHAYAEHVLSSTFFLTHALYDALQRPDAAAAGITTMDQVLAATVVRVNVTGGVDMESFTSRLRAYAHSEEQLAMLCYQIEDDGGESGDGVRVGARGCAEGTSGIAPGEMHTHEPWSPEFFFQWPRRWGHTQTAFHVQFMHARSPTVTGQPACLAHVDTVGVALSHCPGGVPRETMLSTGWMLLIAAAGVVTVGLLVFRRL